MGVLQVGPVVDTYLDEGNQVIEIDIVTPRKASSKKSSKAKKQTWDPNTDRRCHRKRLENGQFAPDNVSDTTAGSAENFCNGSTSDNGSSDVEIAVGVLDLAYFGIDLTHGIQRDLPSRLARGDARKSIKKHSQLRPNGPFEFERRLTPVDSDEDKPTMCYTPKNKRNPAVMVNATLIIRPAGQSCPRAPPIPKDFCDRDIEISKHVAVPDNAELIESEVSDSETPSTKMPASPEVAVTPSKRKAQEPTDVSAQDDETETDASIQITRSPTVRKKGKPRVIASSSSSASDEECIDRSMRLKFRTRQPASSFQSALLKSSSSPDWRYDTSKKPASSQRKKRTPTTLILSSDEDL